MPARCGPTTSHRSPFARTKAILVRRSCRVSRSFIFSARKSQICASRPDSSSAATSRKATTSHFSNPALSAVMEVPFYDCLSPAQLHHDSQAELFARAAARAHFWLAEAPPATTNQAPAAIAPRRPPRSHFVTRSQILRAFKLLNPEEPEEHLLGTQQMIRHSQSARQAAASLLHPESASGTTRPLRPPDVEGNSIRAPPHRSASRGEATSEGAAPVLRPYRFYCRCCCRSHYEQGTEQVPHHCEDVVIAYQTASPQSGLRLPGACGGTENLSCKGQIHCCPSLCLASLIEIGDY